MSLPTPLPLKLALAVSAIVVILLIIDVKYKSVDKHEVVSEGSSAPHSGKMLLSTVEKNWGGLPEQNFVHNKMFPTLPDIDNPLLVICAKYDWVTEHMTKPSNLTSRCRDSWVNAQLRFRLGNFYPQILDRQVGGGTTTSEAVSEQQRHHEHHGKLRKRIRKILDHEGKNATGTPDSRTGGTVSAFSELPAHSLTHDAVPHTVCTKDIERPNTWFRDRDFLALALEHYPQLRPNVPFPLIIHDATVNRNPQKILFAYNRPYNDRSIVLVPLKGYHDPEKFSWLLPAPMNRPVQSQQQNVVPVDTPFEQKRNGIVWRGVSTGPITSDTDVNGIVKNNRFKIVEKYFIPPDSVGVSRTSKDMKSIPGTLSASVANALWPQQKAPMTANRNAVSTTISAAADSSEPNSVVSPTRHRRREDIDIAFTRLVQNTWGPVISARANKLIKPSLNETEQLKYKYILCMEGNDVSTNFIWVLASASCPFHTYPFTYETIFFGSGLQPWVHFVPIQHDASDLEEKLDWCYAHEDVCRQIAVNGQLYIRPFLNATLYTEVSRRVIELYANIWAS